MLSELSWCGDKSLGLVYLEGLGYPGFGGFVDLGLSDTPTPTLPKLPQTEPEVLLVRIILNLTHRQDRGLTKCHLHLLSLNDWDQEQAIHSVNQEYMLAILKR